MPKRSNDFQKLITLINGCLSTTGTVRESALLKDKTNGELREVDIFISSSISTYPINIAIEVRDQKRKADSTWIDSMYAKHSNLPTDKLILVSRSGFFKPAMVKAESFGIETITYSDAFNTDWELAARMTSEGFFELTTIKYTCSAICQKGAQTQIFSPAAKNTTVFLPYREKPTDFEKMAEFFINEPRIMNVLREHIQRTNQSAYTANYTPQPGTYILDSNREKMSLTQFSISLEIKQKRTPIRYAVGNYKKLDVLSGSSYDTENRLIFALVRKSKNEIEGMLLDEHGVRKLVPDPKL